MKALILGFNNFQRVLILLYGPFYMFFVVAKHGLKLMFKNIQLTMKNVLVWYDT